MEEEFEFAWLILLYMREFYSAKSENEHQFVKRAYLAGFMLKMGDQYKLWTPHNLCKPCVEMDKGNKKTIIIWYSYGVVGAEQRCRWLLLLPHKNFWV